MDERTAPNKTFITPVLRLKENSSRGSGKIEESESRGKDDKEPMSGQDPAIAVINSLRLQMAALGLHKNRPLSI